MRYRIAFIDDSTIAGASSIWTNVIVMAKHMAAKTKNQGFEQQKRRYPSARMDTGANHWDGKGNGKAVAETSKGYQAARFCWLRLLRRSPRTIVLLELE